jgi:HD superfamily phosphohydrolase
MTAMSENKRTINSDAGTPTVSGRFRIWDPLYGLSALSLFEKKFIFAPEVQRLRHVRLCNIDSLLIPGAAHVSRFEHVIGVLRLANEWIENHAVSVDDANDLRIAAIVHDIQTGPFGHSIQYILEDNKIGTQFLHEDLAWANRQKYHQMVSANASYLGVRFQVQALCGDRWDRVSKLIAGQGLLGPLISGDIDLDNIDNVVRLAFHAGITQTGDANIPVELARGIVPSAKGLIASANLLPHLTRWQEIRKQLYQFLLLDWAEFSAKAMLTRAFEDAVLIAQVGADSWRMTDEDLIQHFLTQVGESQGIKELTRRLRLGELFTPILIGRSSAVNAYRYLNKIETKRKIETQIKAIASQSKSGLQILVHFILDLKKTERALRIVLKETCAPMILGHNSESLLIGVFASAPMTAKEAKAIATATRSVLRENGCGEIHAINDPMSEADGSSAQMRLF